jgi:hypothetical protein
MIKVASPCPTSRRVMRRGFWAATSDEETSDPGIEEVKGGVKLDPILARMSSGVKAGEREGKKR